MKIRHRITLWITGAGLLASLLFSLVVFYELVEQPYELLDSELNIQARNMVSSLRLKDDPTSLAADPLLLSLGRLYWLKVFDDRQNVVYASPMSRLIDLPLVAGQNIYTVSPRAEHLPGEISGLKPDNLDELTFRVHITTIQRGETFYTIQLAKSMGNLQEEISELILTLLFGFIASAIALILIGYYVAGRILAPISTINRLAWEINDKTLDKRIPLGDTHDELYDLSSSLNTMFDRLQHAFTRQKEFVASASHELKTPITMLRLFFDENICEESLPDVFRDKLTAQEAILARMDRLVKKLLDLSVLELKTTYEPEEYDLARQIDSVLHEFAEIFEAEHIRATTNLPPQLVIYADREKIRRLLINILDNAIKFNWPEGEIRLQAGEDNTLITLEVQNTGVGVPAAEREKVFDQFYRVEKSRSTAHGGSGLGLSIVKRIVELHNGTITLDSAPGEWTKVCIMLPKK